MTVRNSGYRAAQCHREAMAELRRRHLGEFEEIHGDLREAAGYPRKPIGASGGSQAVALLRDRVVQLEAELRAARGGRV